ncbi:MAG: L-histidine N(alpha)-methyltransferase [FCB group bacterium]|nr:L-histidine N(alpha)-methyltransferase [FCB group bacterium]
MFSFPSSNQPSTEFIHYQGQRPDFHAEFLRDVESGLSATPKNIPSRYFYDHTGSQLFEAICDLKDYYPTRTEFSILKELTPELVTRFHESVPIVELGAGSSTKTQVILSAFAARLGKVDYYPIDISPSILNSSGKRITRDIPEINYHGIAADYLEGLDLVRKLPGPKLYLWLGSSIGNFTPAASIRFLSQLRSALHPQDKLLIGLDMVKEESILLQAYNDSEGTTARFNLNLLDRINRELGGHFDLDRFRHRALYNREATRIEMYLVSTERQTVALEALNRRFTFEDGEPIHTENSQKYTPDLIQELLSQSGFHRESMWTDPRQWFSVVLASRS